MLLSSKRPNKRRRRVTTLKDEIWLADTTTGMHWTVWRLMRDGVSFPDEETPFRYRGFRPEDLAQVGGA